MPPWFSSQLERKGSDIVKKFIFVLGFLLIAWTSISVAAETTKYQPNLFTDETSIEDDFKLLNININEYYKPKYNYGKWYVIGMSEGYVDTESFDIQTYFYIYNPSSPKTYEYWYQDDDDLGEEHYNEITDFNITYKLTGKQNSSLSKVLSINYDHHIYKVKGFIYSFKERAEIEILSIQNFMTSGWGYTSESTFKSICNHSKLNGFSVELSFNSTLIIEEYTVVEVEVHQDDNFINGWNSFWSGKDPSVLVYFYNFNFPDHIEYDSVEYAKFQYDYLTVYEKIWTKQNNYGGEWVPDDRYTNDCIKDIKNREKVISEYRDDSKTLRVNNNSQELTFPTFYLGNRVTAKQFGTLKIEESDEKLFDYDCSILLESTYKTRSDWYGKGPSGKLNQHYMELDYTTLDKVEILELHYKNDGILYKCQVVNKPVDNEDFDKVDTTPPESAWTKFCNWFKDQFPWSLLIFAAPVLLIIAAILFPHVFSLILKYIVAGFKSVISALQWVVKAIIYIITLPIRLIIRIFKRE